MEVLLGNTAWNGMKNGRDLAPRGGNVDETVKKNWGQGPMGLTRRRGGYLLGKGSRNCMTRSRRRPS